MGTYFRNQTLKNRIQWKKWIVRHFFYFNVSTAYITRSFLGIVNACDPIVSTGLPESILKNKEETSRQQKMISCKGKTRASKNNPLLKLPRFLGLHFYLLGEQNSPRIFKHNLIQMRGNIHIL